MKGLSFFNKIIFALNIVFTTLLLIACVVPYISVDLLPFLSFLSLAVPFLVGINVLFFLYWAIQRKRQMRTPLLILIFGYFVLGTFLKFNFSEPVFQKEDLKVMSYNVRGFNEFGWSKRKSVFKDISTLIDGEQPDIICFQEVGFTMKADFLNYPYHHLQKIYTGDKVHMGIFSKYPILHAELISFPNSINDGSYADIVYKGDTLRIYNVHMQSLGITPGSGVLRSQSSDRLYRRVTKAFKQQQRQAEMIAEHMANSPYRTLLCGDFNNTQFSRMYRIIKADMQDTFVEEGSGYGKTLDFFRIPLRIDFILADEAFEIKEHKNYDLKYSDHFPLMASFRLKK